MIRPLVSFGADFTVASHPVAKPAPLCSSCGFELAAGPTVFCCDAAAVAYADREGLPLCETCQMPDESGEGRCESCVLNAYLYAPERGEG